MKQSSISFKEISQSLKTEQLPLKTRMCLLTRRGIFMPWLSSSLEMVLKIVLDYVLTALRTWTLLILLFFYSKMPLPNISWNKCKKVMFGWDILLIELQAITSFRTIAYFNEQNAQDGAICQNSQVSIQVFHNSLRDCCIQFQLDANYRLRMLLRPHKISSLISTNRKQSNPQLQPNRRYRSLEMMNSFKDKAFNSIWDKVCLFSLWR